MHTHALYCYGYNVNTSRMRIRAHDGNYYFYNNTIRDRVTSVPTYKLHTPYILRNTMSTDVSDNTLVAVVKFTFLAIP